VLAGWARIYLRIASEVLVCIGGVNIQAHKVDLHIKRGHMGAVFCRNRTSFQVSDGAPTAPLSICRAHHNNSLK
jgi:hypothetical protein